MKRALASAVALLAALMSAASPVMAAEDDKTFFEGVQGSWAGAGEVVAGKYKGTKFNCHFKGSSHAEKTGMALDGGCRVGVFMQNMSASFEKKGKSYSGTFLDGAAGKGLDVISGSVDGKKAVFGLNRSQLRGAMLARLADQDTMNVTISVRVSDDMVPVIGMSLKRVDATAVGTVAKN
ncbi:hypothetical protein [Tianweitania sediminis]|jgi:hypothetical protein|uniref:Uncharacterized protein n=1 Tax=Tianweitania sediminis TaxID=1502156 RepID=A0A8J7R2M8_9HYPH|nr:hypothetical protein [Tianweitania sediminis]MBP0439768.1 hypothetical protein [Tianweitania sediminis]HEV7416060.1 hypothetical protein [Tianweitania sediminis]